MANAGKKKADDTAKINEEDLDIASEEVTNSSEKVTSGKAKKTSSSKSKSAAGKKEIPLSEEISSDESESSSHEDENDDIVQERNKYLRLAAEYDNFRKRSAKERETTYIAARVDTIAKLLPVYDNLERALKMECSDEAFYKGVQMTMAQVLEIFEGMEVKPIPAVGEPFDPNHHNAVMTIEDPELGSKIVAEEFQKGFILGDRVIRHSTVVVAN